MNNSEMLFVDCCTSDGFIVGLNENTGVNGLTRFRGKFQEAEAVNKNKRLYPFSILDENVKKLNEAIGARGLVGELDHPLDSIIHFDKCSHVITKLYWEGNVLMGEGEVLPTPHGKILKALLDSGIRVGISSRGVGSGKVDENGILVISESYKLITFDAVADPSTFAAFQEKVVGTKRENMHGFNTDNSNLQNNSRIPSKNESKCIDKRVNKDALIACLGGIIKEETSNLKARVNG